MADLIRQAQRTPLGSPVWPSQGVETATTIGWYAVPVLTEAQANGIQGDYAPAWAAIRHRSFDITAPDRSDSRNRYLLDRPSYVAAEKWNENVSRTQEYAYSDWAAHRIVRQAGAGTDVDRLLKRARNWAKATDVGIGFTRRRVTNGGWRSTYDSVRFDHMPMPAWQAASPDRHDIDGLIAHVGGGAAFKRKLDALFSAPSLLSPQNRRRTWPGWRINTLMRTSRHSTGPVCTPMSAPVENKGNGPVAVPRGTATPPTASSATTIAAR